MCFSAAASSENDQGSMNFASKTAPVSLTSPSGVAAIQCIVQWRAATLDGLVKETGAVFEAKFMLPWSFSEEAAAEKHMAQLQHNMLVTGTKKSVLSIINGGGKWIELSIEADPIYQTILIAAAKAFWRAVKTGEARRCC